MSGRPATALPTASRTCSDEIGLTYAGRRVLVVGGGHSAINVALDLLRLKKEAPGTRVTWALRRDRFDRLLGGGINDELPERGALGLAAKRAIETGQLEMLAPFAAERVAAERGRAACDGARRGSAR